MKSKWVFKVKSNGVFHQSLLAFGYNKVPGVDFSKNYSPVVHKITYRLLILDMIIFGYQPILLMLKRYFLNGCLDKEIYVECLPGMKNVWGLDDLLLGRCIYGLVQAKIQ